ncbi:MAG: FMN-binding protein [Candidatus Dormibacter sp.]
MPTRAAVAIVATVTALILLFSFKTPPSNNLRTSGWASVLSTPAPTVPSAPDTSPPTAASSSPTPSPTAPGLKDGQYTGQDFPNQFGDVQVKVIIAAGRITNVQAIQLPVDRQRSAEISQYAAPQLHDEVLQAQSAQIDSLSGATYTSYGYAQSVQSALDQAHA